MDEVEAHYDEANYTELDDDVAEARAREQADGNAKTNMFTNRMLVEEKVRRTPRKEGPT